MKPCPSFHGYSVSEDGRVFSHRRRGFRDGRKQHGGTTSCIDAAYIYELSQARTVKGYRTVGVVLVTGRSRRVGVHQLVADAFHGPVPPGHEVRHLDGNPANNAPWNLAYGTSFDNAADRVRHGRYTSGGNHHNAKLTDQQAEEIRKRRHSGEKVKSLAEAFEVSVSTIESVIYGKAYRAEKNTFKRLQA